MAEQQYAGFWIRTGAHVIDTILITLIITPLIGMVFGNSNFPMAYFLSQAVLPAIAVIAFWYYKSATPGKIILKLKIVDIKSGGKPTIMQLIGRYLAYLIAMMPLFIGLIWVGFDKKKQGWHDKLADTAVVKISRSTDA